MSNEYRIKLALDAQGHRCFTSFHMAENAQQALGLAIFYRGFSSAIVMSVARREGAEWLNIECDDGSVTEDLPVIAVECPAPSPVPLDAPFTDISTIHEYDLDQKLSNPVRCF